MRGWAKQISASVSLAPSPACSPAELGVQQLLAPKCCWRFPGKENQELTGGWMLMVRWVLLALPITQAWLQLGKSTKEQSEPLGVALIPSFAWIPTCG